MKTARELGVQRHQLPVPPRRKRTALIIRRKTFGLTQSRVAEQLGITESALSRIENGLKDPSFRVAQQLARFYECGLDALFPADEWGDPPENTQR